MTTMAIDNKDKKVLNVPHLRFPEFSGEWENTELQYIAPNICSGKDKPTSNGTVALYGSTGIIGMTRLASYNEEIVLVARVGANAGQLQITTIPCGVTDNTLIINAKEWNRYIYYYLQHYNLNRLVFGSGQPLITGSMLKKLKIIYGEESERNKIVNLLCLLDERIATQNKIIEKLQSLIKGLSQQLLSSENDWILYRLDDLAQIKSGYSGTQVSYQTPYKVSRIETISKHCIDIQRIGYVECIPESYRLNVGNILFSNINSIQYIGNTAYLDKDYGLYHGMNLLRIIPNTTIVRPRFLHLLLCTDWAINHFQTICNKAVSQASINQTALGKSRFPIPPMSVQQQICSMFELTERKLDNEQEYISCLQQQKRYLLQKMFI